MATRDRNDMPHGRIEREIERERHERHLHDEARAGLSPVDDLRTKDARERADTSTLKRHGAK